MTNFKGTKGPWKLAFNDCSFYTSVRNMDDSRKICVSRVNDFEIQNANMKLISKAPEMLEMLEKISNILNVDEFLHDTSIRQYFYHQIQEINDLIKEATEL